MDSSRAELQVSEESLVHGTAGGEMPDPSKASEIRRRLDVDSSALLGRLGRPAVLIPFAVGLLSVGAVFLLRSTREINR